VGSSPLASVQVPTGLNDILRCRESGLASRLHGSCSSSAVTCCERDILGDFFLYMPKCACEFAAAPMHSVVKSIVESLTLRSLVAMTSTLVGPLAIESLGHPNHEYMRFELEPEMTENVQEDVRVLYTWRWRANEGEWGCMPGRA
jgi:hypothetical protein